MKSSKTKSGATSPDDRDLMLYVDDEIDAESGLLADVQRLVDTDETAQNKIAALRLGGEMLRAHVRSGEGAADSIADAVMARIEASDFPAARDDLDVAPLPVGGAPNGAGRVVIPITERKEAPVPRVDSKRAVANDNAKTIWALAAAAVAAAAAMMIWGKVDDGTLPGSNEQPRIARQQSTDVAPAPPEPPVLRGDDPGLVTPDVDVDVGVEVAAVDFGNGQGSIFYVPSGAAAGATTTVVWLAEDEAGGP